MSLQTPETPIILASGSQIRGRILTDAGLEIRAVKSGVDEETWRNAMRAEGIAPSEQAMQLAELKAQKVSMSDAAPQTSLVIGCDQMLSLGSAVFDKPENRDDARAHLTALSGKTHTLETAICIAEGGNIVWRFLAQPKLSMRRLDDGFIDTYIANCGDSILETVGGYQLESLGSHLFNKIQGDYFSILGMPLLPLLDYLRVRGVIAG